MAAPPSYHISHLFRSNPFSLPLPQMQDPIFGFSFVVFFFFVALSLTLLSFPLLHKRWSKTEKKQGQQPGLAPNPEIEKGHDDDPSVVKHSLSRVVDEVHRHDDDSPTHSLPLDGLPPDSAKWTSFSDEEGCDDPNSISSGMNGEAEGPGGEQGGKKKKRKAKKKKVNSVAEGGGQKARAGSDSGHRMESACLYPFTSSSSAMQRKIKQQYDQLVRCNESKKLTLAQVVQFANSLVDARSELQHRADVIQRKFVITKALLCKADRSSFDRLRQQIYKLELEQRRLEEDASVYNWLQHQLKLSPAYKKMLEIGACMEKEKSSELGENRDDEFAGISFEELLAQEKKDSFWQKNGKSRLCSS